MRAVVITGADDPGRMTETEDPEPAAGELRVRVKAAGVNPIDGKVAGGVYGPVEYPFVPGIDGAGIVTDLGPGVTQFSAGDRVFGRLGEEGRGSWAELVVAPENGVITHIPPGLDFETAAAIPVAGMTALGVLQELALPPQSGILLILGATGGVGVFLTQLAARSGALVVATARPELCDRTRELGATLTIDHTSAIPLYAQLEAAGIAELHGIADLVGDPDLVASFAALVRPGGSIISTAGGADPEKLAGSSIKAGNYHREATRSMLEELARLVASGDITVPVERKVPLSAGPAILEESRRGHLHGKTVLEV